MGQPAQHRWDDIEPDFPMDKVERRRILGDNVMLSRFVLEEGCDVPVHQHANEQIAIVLSGRIRFRVGEPGSSAQRDVELGPGQVLHLPGDEPHGAYALERCVLIDVFSPPSEATGVDQK